MQDHRARHATRLIDVVPVVERGSLAREHRLHQRFVSEVEGDVVVRVAEAEAARSDKPANDTQRVPPKKLSYKQKFALESLPGRMEEASGRIRALEAKLHDPALFARDPAAFGNTASALERERAALVAMEEEWLELEMLREELEG